MITNAVKKARVLVGFYREVKGLEKADAFFQACLDKGLSREERHALSLLLK